MIVSDGRSNRSGDREVGAAAFARAFCVWFMDARLIGGSPCVVIATMQASFAPGNLRYRWLTTVYYQARALPPAKQRQTSWRVCAFGILVHAAVASMRHFRVRPAVGDVATRKQRCITHQVLGTP
jgi:hypothetical protein